MLDNNIKISIIVPIYNVENYIEKCLQSIYNQSFQSFELILINDGSTDASATIAEDKVKLFKNARLINQVNAGLSAARNTGIDNANGDYLVFVDSDDTIDTYMLEKMHRKAIDTRSDIVVCDMKYIYDNYEEFSSGGDFEDFNIKDRPDLLAINNSACNKLYRRSLFSDVRFPIGLWYEDLATVPILYFKANRISKVNEALYFYYQRNTSIAHSLKPKIFDVYEAINIVQEYINTHQTEQINEFSSVIHHMFLNHGLYLTTLRIINSSENKNQCIDYLIQNRLIINTYYKEWSNSVFKSKFKLKVKLLLLLYKFNLIVVVYWLLKKKT